jgi:hypothetical protein
VIGGDPGIGRRQGAAEDGGPAGARRPAGGRGPAPDGRGGPDVVAVGGGHGQAVTLRAARRYAGRVTGVVSVADDGGSSGRLRRELGIVPPGDIRTCLVALAAEGSLLARAFEHRFAAVVGKGVADGCRCASAADGGGGAASGALADAVAVGHDGASTADGDHRGHALGNLVLAGLLAVSGDLQVAVDEAAALLGAVGRVPNTDGLSWSRIGLSLDPAGAVPVNAYYQTAVPNIYAPGDVNGQVLLAHAATRQSQIAAQHWLGAATFPPALVVPHVIFTTPEIAAVGADSRALGAHPSWELTRWPYHQDARALILGDAEGYAQLIWDRASHEIRGLQVIGRDAGELIEEVTYVITHGGTVDELVASIHPHPTLNEVISEVASAALQSSVITLPLSLGR